MSKVFVFGIDGAPPEYVFGEWLDDLPNIKKLINEGCYAKLNSTIPPLSVTAWSSIVTGKSPSDTGLLEYVYRKNNSYTDRSVVTANSLKEKTIWRILSDNEKKSIIGYLILTWPIKSFNGLMVSGSLTPSGAESVFPHELKEELLPIFREIPTADIVNFRDFTKEQVIEAVKELTERQISIASHLLKTKEWDFFFWVAGLSDRMNHSFWRYLDKKHRKYDPNSPYTKTLKDYYVYLDKKLGEFLSALEKDTSVIVLSDHGITRMHTRVNLTDWLIKEGYMHLKTPVTGKCEFNPEMVDWSKTRVFAIGAYEGQIFINLKGREPDGIVNPEDKDELIGELIGKLKKIKGDDGSVLDTKFFKKENHFKGKREDIAPDIIIYFDNLQYGCNTTLIGNETLWGPQTAKGSDDSGHSRQGIFIMKNGKLKNKDLGEISYLDVAPTILNLLGLEVPNDMKGKIID